MPKILINLEIDYEELIKQYKWLTTVHEKMSKGYPERQPKSEMLGLETMLEFMIEDVFGSTRIYRSYEGPEHRSYFVILPDESALTAVVSEGKALGNKIDREAYPWTELESGWVPVVHGSAAEEVSILDVEPELRIMIREFISEGGMLESDQT